MGNAKFTQGPWATGGLCPSRIYGKQRDDKNVLIAATGSVLQNSGANAHLIAAAPEMYGMLERILKPYGREDISDDAIENLLAKARGEHE